MNSRVQQGSFEAHSLPSTVDSWNYEEKQGLAHMEFKVAVLFCGKSVAKVIRARRSSFEGKNNTLKKSCVLEPGDSLALFFT
jgi:hypothetical protein